MAHTPLAATQLQVAVAVAVAVAVLLAVWVVLVLLVVVLVGVGVQTHTHTHLLCMHTHGTANKRRYPLGAPPRVVFSGGDGANTDAGVRLSAVCCLLQAPVL